jgi:hypothetical protein
MTSRLLKVGLAAGCAVGEDVGGAWVAVGGTGVAVGTAVGADVGGAWVAVGVVVPHALNTMLMTTDRLAVIKNFSLIAFSSLSCDWGGF